VRKNQLVTQISPIRVHDTAIDLEVEVECPGHADAMRYEGRDALVQRLNSAPVHADMLRPTESRHKAMHTDVVGKRTAMFHLNVTRPT
jgi:hypothetical protein